MSVILKRAFSTCQVQYAIKNVTVIGGGLMGSGIAQVTAQAGLNATVVDLNEGVLENTKQKINESIQRVAKKLHKNDEEKKSAFINGSLSNLKFTTDLKQSLVKTDLVVEAIVENLEKKRELFKFVELNVPEETILASNTSSFLITDIAVNSKRRDRFGGLHFFSPVPVMKLLEVIRIAETSEETYQSLVTYGQTIGKTTVTCKDTPGFIVNRLLVPLMAECVRMIERGDCTPRDLDMAMKLGAGYPMGPFELADFTGIDTLKSILDGWSKKYPEVALFKPCDMVNKLVEEGKLGMKTGEGFYSYKK